MLGRTRLQVGDVLGFDKRGGMNSGAKIWGSFAELIRERKRMHTDFSIAYELVKSMSRGILLFGFVDSQLWVGVASYCTVVTEACRAHDIKWYLFVSQQVEMLL
jgi:hypothetical protein